MLPKIRYQPINQRSLDCLQGQDCRELHLHLMFCGRLKCPKALQGVACYYIYIIRVEARCSAIFSMFTVLFYGHYYSLYCTVLACKCVFHSESFNTFQNVSPGLRLYLLPNTNSVFLLPTMFAFKKCNIINL